MPIKIGFRWLEWVLIGLAVALPAMPARAERLITVSAVIAPESFWVKKSAGSSVGGHEQTSSKSGKAGSKTHGLGPAMNTSAGALGAKKDSSITSELAAGKSVPWSIVVGLTLLTLLPALLLSMTPMVRLLVVFHFLRQALGTQTAPSNQILMGLALMMTWFLMQPVLLEVEQTAVAPYSAGTITGEQALDLGGDLKEVSVQVANDRLGHRLIDARMHLTRTWAIQQALWRMNRDFFHKSSRFCDSSH